MVTFFSDEKKRQITLASCKGVGGVTLIFDDPFLSQAPSSKGVQFKAYFGLVVNILTLKIK